MLLGVLFAQGCDRAAPPPPPAADTFEVKLPMPGTPLLHPTDSPDVLLDKAIAAFGGPEKLARWKCGHVKYLARSETIPILDEKPSDIEEFFQMPGHIKRIARIGSGGREQTVTFVIGSEQGWEYRPDGRTRLLSSDSVFAVLRTEHAFADFCNLARLRSPYIRLSVRDEQIIHGRAAVVLHAETDFTLPTDFLFDRATGLLLQSVRRMPQSGGGEKVVETSLGDYRDVGGSPVPHRIQGRCDGKVLLDFKITELEFLDHLDDSVFAPP
jgi:hypothetical protein